MLQLPVKLAAIPLELFLVAASGSPDICLSPSISLCLPPPAQTQEMVCMRSPSCFILVLIPPIFHLSSFQFLPLDHPPLLAQAHLPLTAAMRGHLDVHSVLLERVYIKIKQSYPCDPGVA